MEKRCSKCKKLKNINEFHKDNTKKDGLSCHCAYCANKRSRDYYYKNKNKIKHSHKLYKEKNKDEYKEMHRIADRKWYYKNRDKKISSTKELKEKNKKQQKEYRKIYSAKFRKYQKINLEVM